MWSSVQIWPPRPIIARDSEVSTIIKILLSKNYLKKINILIIFIFTSITFSINHNSLVTTPIFLMNGDKRISQGTGFFYNENTTANETFLVTNYHVVTGKSPEEEMPNTGNFIEFNVRGDKNTQHYYNVKLPLYEMNGIPVWKESKKFPLADVVAIHLPKNVDRFVGSILSKKEIDSDVKVSVGSRVVVIGYPGGLFDEKNMLPIWKNGRIASEPNVDFNGLPNIIIDITSYGGMSGAPVLIHSTGAYETPDIIEGNKRRFGMSYGAIPKLIGVFSDKYVSEVKLPLFDENKKEQIASFSVFIDDSLGLGVIWKSIVIEDIVDNY
jgi:hypothetical protein